MALSSGEDLQQVWFDAVVKAFGLSPLSFLIAGSMTPPGVSSRELWSFYDVIPADTGGHYYEPTFSRFSDCYGAVVNLIIPQFGTEWRQAVGDDYPRWVSFLESGPEIPAGGMLELFSGWARSTIADPTRAERAISAYSGILFSTVPVAQARFIEAHGSYAFSKSITDARAAVSQAPSYRFSIDSTPRLGTAKPVFPAWLAGSLASISDAQTHRHTKSALLKLAAQRVTGSAVFDHQTGVAAQPLQSRQQVGDKLYPAWYSSAALDLAFQTHGEPVWPAGIKPTWEQTFGPSGSLQRLVTRVVLVDGVDIELESHADFSDQEQKALQQAAAEGIAPLFAIPPAPGKSRRPTLSLSIIKQEDVFKIFIKSPPGHVLVFGVVATPVGSIAG